MVVEEFDKIEEYYQALIDRNSQYVGSFYVGVKTTGIFCIATCRARKPKKENVVFYNDAKSALAYGFRPCKVCKPTSNVDDPPEEVKRVIQLITENPTQKIKDYDLKTLGYSPEKIRRWFKAHHEMTFHTYQRMIRINLAYETLKKGEKVITSAYASGFESLSGFGYTFKQLMNDSPENAKNINVINLYRFATPLGPMYAGATDAGICLLEFTDRRMLETEFEELQRLLKARIVVGENEHIKQAVAQVTEYFAGNRIEFDLKLLTPGSEFQCSVWKELQNIPSGATRSYKEQAMALGDKNAVRAVASANGKNRIAIVIPCHRVIGSNGELTGYAGGLTRKRWLLDHESGQLSLGV